ncbi:hypothetical protein U8326_00945 [Tsuneonella sp. CC-YZS046]|uniref:hypothetical protein n=1 Tax=Tsuneonella sp. CC-YZS046 TaxID=3042152 RepID=UPI002D78513A|nr:hypothetical protein [Tsuneonella sp. CC-YZS046]WRO66767.1 hypothetical protein U8326_00945 [Tsuneonella sp. CC-YZS046]
MPFDRFRALSSALALLGGMLPLAAPAAQAAGDYGCDSRTIKAAPVRLASVPVNRFLDSLGVNIHIDQGYDPDSYIEPLHYLGVRQVRDGNRNVNNMLHLARETGVRFSLISTGNIPHVMGVARMLAKADALLAVEGPNEPNNFPIEYKWRKGGGSHGWVVVAELQRDLYAQVKSDRVLGKYPVFGPSETGAQTENAGLQFLKIPKGADTLLPEGTVFSDYANVHNYVGGVDNHYGDNQAWNAADPTLWGEGNGLVANHGRTWHRRFPGYSDDQLPSLPRVSTETGFPAGADAREQHRQGAVLVNTYLAQFHRGWTYTFLYQLRDNEGGKSLQGLYTGNRLKLAAHYIHNLTAILADDPKAADPKPGTVQFATDSPAVHALAFAKSTGKRAVVVWGERVSGSDPARVDFGSPVSVKIFDITRGKEPIDTLGSVRSVCLDLSDHAMVLEY